MSISNVQRWQGGLTLVELLVGLVIGLVLSLAAASLYLATRETARGSQSISNVNETGKIAMDMIGREIQKAGFYPAQFGSTAVDSTFAGEYFNAKEVGVATSLFNTGLYGCSGARYKPSTKTCDTPSAGEPDSIILNYFSSTEFGATSLLGNAHDCNRQPVSADATNTARAAAGLPLFVSNRFSVVAGGSYTDTDGNVVNLRSLGCHGNGDEAQTAAQRALEGVEDMVIRYGIYGSGTDQTPAEFLTAAEVNLAGTLNAGTADQRTPWQRVTAVSICIVVRSLAGTRQEDEVGNVRQYRNCRSATPVDLPAGTRYVYKSFERVYAVRNNLTGNL